MVDEPEGPGASPPDLETERAALARARTAVAARLDRLRTFRGAGADALADQWLEAVAAGAVEELQRDLVVFGRIDDDRPWRIGLYGVDEGGEQLVVDWRARFAEGFYRATLEDPKGLARRVTYVGTIDDLFVEDFADGSVEGTSPLLAELSRERGSTMRAAVATLQVEQDRLVRLPPRDRLVVRGGPGTGKTVVGLHRAAWLAYDDTRLTADRILVLGPSERYLRYVATVLPTLGEARIRQATMDGLLGPSSPAGSDERWVDLLDRFEASLLRPGELAVGRRTVAAAAIDEAIAAAQARALPWRDRRKSFVLALRRLVPAADPKEIAAAANRAWPSVTTKVAWARLRRRATLVALDADPDLVDAWLAADGDGALHDEVRARFEGVPAKYSHVIVDEAQDLSLLQLRAVLRRADGVTLVGDDAQRSNPLGIGLDRATALAGAELAELRTAYRMSAEIADWLNDLAVAAGLPAVVLEGIRPTGDPVRVGGSVEDEAVRLRQRWSNVAVLRAGEVWDHKGVEYDAVVVDGTGMTGAEVYLAASRAAHELAVVDLEASLRPGAADAA
jgi:hypothetical protein